MCVRKKNENVDRWLCQLEKVSNVKTSYRRNPLKEKKKEENEKVKNGRERWNGKE